MECTVVALLSAALLPAVAHLAPGNRADLPPRIVSAEVFGDSYLTAMQQSARRAQPDPVQAVPRLLALLGRIDQIEALTSADRARMRRGLEGRLLQLRGRLVRDLRASARRSSARSLSLAGPADTAQALRLIDLIQKTVAPESWEVNGGRGTISYYSPLQALVVRQTGEVHHELSGVLEQLRR